jgi:hypothetical protein
MKKPGFVKIEDGDGTHVWMFCDTAEYQQNSRIRGHEKILAVCPLHLDDEGRAVLEAIWLLTGEGDRWDNVCRLFEAALELGQKHPA